jgi:biotin carboxyl carrier protein
MGETGWEMARQALDVARERGFRHVRIRGEGLRFRAVFGAGPVLGATADEEEPSETGRLVEVTSHAVGYFREAGEPLEAGRKVAADEVLGEVVALGIANEVLSPVAGWVESVEVRAGDVVDYGRVVALVRPE